MCTVIELFTPSLLSLIDQHCEFELVLCWVYHTRQGGGRESSLLKRETEHLWLRRPSKWNRCHPRLAICLPLVFIVQLLVHFSCQFCQSAHTVSPCGCRRVVSSRVSLPPLAFAHVITWCVRRAAHQAGCGASGGKGCHVNGQTHGHGIGQ